MKLRNSPASPAFAQIPTARCYRQYRTPLRLILVLFLTAFPFGLTQAQSQPRYETFGGGPPDHWLVGAEVYLWGASVGGDTATGDKIDISFDELVKDLKFGFMGTLAATRGKWTAYSNLIYLDVSDNIRQTIDLGPEAFRVRADIDLKGFVTTLGGAYRVYQSETSRFNVTLGARYLWLDLDIDTNIDELADFRISDSGDVWDGVVGLRGKTDLTDRWYLTYYADVGTGESDYTWQALAAISYRCNRFDYVGGYRYLDWEFDDSPLLSDLNLSGVFAGIKFSF
ncbi:hypothetical protein [Microbulbifer sp. SAOS-129_SWC]|uniref:hypothetical protein n=1 Tax=Microbulbifer sp. SAOS-129_SWC TaxID=3145235 RepID=UPI0032172F92